MTREEALDVMNILRFGTFEEIINTEEIVNKALDVAIEALKDRPHGEWLSHYDYCKKHELIPSGLIAFWWCNQCEQGVEIKTNFCPNCGADMRKEGDENDI